MTPQDKNLKQIKTAKTVYPQVYSYTLPDFPENNGSQKIGYTERQSVDERIKEQTKTAAKQLNYDKLWSAPAFFDGNSKDNFTDHDFHKFLIKSGVEPKPNLGQEWFYFDGTPERSKRLFDDFRAGGMKALQQSDGKTPYTLREEQELAVGGALDYFRAHENGEFLWNCKPRFGKTLATYDLAKRLNARKVLIVTNRPAIANSWFDDFEKFIDGYYFISETDSLKTRPTISRTAFNDIDDIDKKCIVFLSLQDLKGSRYFGGNYNKLEWVANLQWDLLVIDEAHEGIDTGRTDAAFDILKRSNTLHLSGTPFKALANQKFPQEAIFNWTYLDEQKVKRAEIEDGEVGAHTDMPDLRLFTYRISEMATEAINAGLDVGGENVDFSFDLNDFFATSGGKFVREAAVKEFLHNLTTNEKYPFSTPELRNELKHTFWYVGNRVESVKALAALLENDPVFGKKGSDSHKIVIAAGDGKPLENEDYNAAEIENYSANEKSFDKVRRAIKENAKTITLSCGQLTTGITIPEWSAVLMLTDIKTPAPYMQAAFRAQNPYKFIEDGQLKRKTSAYLFDFAPTRVLEIYDQFANALSPVAAAGQITDAERRANIKELLNFFPVISEDTDGQMVELDAEKVLTFPNALAAVDIVKARFMSNKLFRDGFNVFAMPRELEEIVDKMDKVQNKRLAKTDQKIDLDAAKTAKADQKIKVNENTAAILGEKIYAANVERLVDNAVSDETPEETLASLPEKVEAVAEPLIAKYKEIYHATDKETDDLKDTVNEKIKVAVAEYESSEIKDAAKLTEALNAAIATDGIENHIEKKEAQAVEEVKKSKEDEIKDRLRSFTRTIPEFVMANAGREEITLDNFDAAISDADFEDLTNIAKAEFHELRDGVDYDDAETGQRKHFDGVFDRYKFNAAIAEFRAKKAELANYFKTDENIFDLIPSQKNNQIFTPKKVVKMMIDDLAAEKPDLFTRTDSRFIDLYMKSGLYITEIVKRLFAGTRKQYASDADCVRHILEHQVYGLAPTKILYDITTNFIFGFDAADAISRDHFAMHDLLPEAKADGGDIKSNGRNGVSNANRNNVPNVIPNLFQDLKNEGGENMLKFDAVVGNPPYQITVSESGSNQHDMPIYNYFYDAAFKLGKISALISPARFLTNAGYTPKPWNKQMLDDPHNKIVYYNIKSAEVFPGTDIKGGVVVILHDNERQIGPIGLFTPDETLTGIAKKVKKYIDADGGRSIKDILYNETKMNLETVYADFPHYQTIRPKSHIRDACLGTDSLIIFPEMLVENRDTEHTLEIYGLIKNKRYTRWINPKYVTDTPTTTKFGKWKVLVPKANGSGAIGEVISTPVIGTPVMGHTMSFRSIGSFDTKEEAENLLKYIKTKFFRAMIGVLKTTQDMPPRVFAYVAFPAQDFKTGTGDIDWTKSIAEIDRQLYAKYKLSPEEINFIETRVKEMK